MVVEEKRYVELKKIVIKYRKEPNLLDSFLISGSFYLWI